MITRALVLAAGMGTRLRGQWDEQPKGLLPVDGISLIARSVAHLKVMGIRDIVLVTGHLASRYEERAAELGGLRCVHNADYARAGSFFSLCVGAAALPGPFLLLESDLLYEPAALDALLSHPHPDLVLVGQSPMHDKVFVAASPEGRLTGLSKRPENAPGACGEFVGITKISSELAARLLAMHDPDRAGWDYETALVHAAATTDVRVLARPDIAWCEIDDGLHWSRAMDLVWPAIQRKSRHAHQA
jgi:choline kinase